MIPPFQGVCGTERYVLRAYGSYQFITNLISYTSRVDLPLTQIM